MGSFSGSEDEWKDCTNQSPIITPRKNLEMERLFSLVDGEPIINRDLLHSICEQIQHRKVAIISTAGKFRQGKTFWNNILLKMLEKENATFAPSDLIGGPGGVNFKSGNERHTLGIMIWPKVFLRRDRDRDELAVILMDTQGTFDTQSDPSDSVVIFAISLLMSSFLVFNLKDQLNFQDLDALKTFITFSQRNTLKVGQNFLFMIRDSIGESGFKAGREYLNSVRIQTKQSSEPRMLMDGIFKAFEEIECCKISLPNPAVREANGGTIKAGDCGDEFLSDLTHCAKEILWKLEPKMVMGTALTGYSFKDYVEQIVKFIKEQDLSNLGSAYSTVSRFSFEKARNAGQTIFSRLIDESNQRNLHKPKDPESYRQELQSIFDQSLKEFEKIPLFGSFEEKQKARNDFVKILEEDCHKKEKFNEIFFIKHKIDEAVDVSHKSYETEMNSDMSQAFLGRNHIERLDERHRIASQDAINHFATAVHSFGSQAQYINEKETELKRRIEECYQKLRHKAAFFELNLKQEDLFNELLQGYAQNLSERVERIRKLEEVEGSIREAQSSMRADYINKRDQFMNVAKKIMPELEEDTLRKTLEDNMDSKKAEFKKSEIDFRGHVENHLQREDLRMRVEGLHRKLAEEQKKHGYELEDTKKQMKDLQELLRNQQQLGRRYESENSMNQMLPFLLMNQRDSEQRLLNQDYRSQFTTLHSEQNRLREEIRLDQERQNLQREGQRRRHSEDRQRQEVEETRVNQRPEPPVEPLQRPNDNGANNAAGPPNGGILPVLAQGALNLLTYGISFALRVPRP